MSKRNARTSVSALPSTDAQILHSAKSDAQDNRSPAGSSPQSPGQTVADPVNRRVSEILDQLAAGLRADDEMESDRLTLARNGGSLVLELKRIVPFGKYMDKLKERFPKSSYHKLHRWRFLAEHEAEIEATLRAYPNVAWGPTKMIAYLKGLGSPGNGTGQDEDGDTGDQNGDPEENTGPLLDEEAGGEGQADDSQEGD